MRALKFFGVISLGIRPSQSTLKSLQSLPVFLPAAGKCPRELQRAPCLELLRRIHTSQPLLKKKNILSDPLPSKVKPSDVKVLLLLEDGSSLGIVTKVEAQRIASLKELRLVSVAEYPALKQSLNELTSTYPVYKMMSGSDLQDLRTKDHLQKKEEKKLKVAQKILQLSAASNDHDIGIKIRHAEAWLQKGDSVKVAIMGRVDMQSRMEELHKMVLSQLKHVSKPAVAGLSKSERSISFYLASSVGVEGDQSEKPSDKTKEEAHEGPTDRATDPPSS
ncbi:hypothetical protein BV898_09902 [Hypsibius exemplaris]|uniref:Translation initiation factor IF-3, mitochondrial n=1 Tax=Hypsibius exemplaris TaxID=2072580 RepID=A0A1W0WL80_HYPEX|nr:hypothetical protein BV898_09902 [Hypsibius exemplaris]